jgi:hypothetical protein
MPESDDNIDNGQKSSRSSSDEGKREPIPTPSYADLAEAGPEPSEYSFRRGYWRGWLEALDILYELDYLTDDGAAHMERFVFGLLSQWVDRALPKCVRGEDGKMHYDCHAEPLPTEWLPDIASTAPRCARAHSSGSSSASRSGR